MKKKIIFVVILAAFLTAVYSEGNAKDVPLTDIEDALKSNTDMTAMEKCGDRMLMQFLGLDYQQFDSYIYYKGTEALSVDELLIIKGKPQQDLGSAKDAAEKRIESQIKTFEGYGPKQVAQLEDARVKIKGDYLFYSVGSLTDEWEEVFKNVI